MSANKFRYYEVTTTYTVKANSKSDALSLTRRTRGVPGKVLAFESTVDRIPATTAHAATA